MPLVAHLIIHIAATSWFFASFWNDDAALMGGGAAYVGAVLLVMWTLVI